MFTPILCRRKVSVALRGVRSLFPGFSAADSHCAPQLQQLQCYFGCQFSVLRSNYSVNSVVTFRAKYVFHDLKSPSSNIPKKETRHFLAVYVRILKAGKCFLLPLLALWISSSLSYFFFRFELGVRLYHALFFGYY